MPEHESRMNADHDLASIAEAILETLATQFPICMSSDEFHFFPQSRAKAFDWHRWDDFSPAAADEIVEKMSHWARQLEAEKPPAASKEQTIDRAMLHRVICTLRDQLELAAPHAVQPTYYLTIIGMGLAEALEAGPLCLEKRLKNLPAFIEQAGRNLKCIPNLFRDLGIEMLQQQKKWVVSLPMARTERELIQDAYGRLNVHLREVSVKEDFLPPIELYERIAFEHIGCRLKADDIARELQDEISETRAILKQTAATIAPGGKWQEVVGSLPHPPDHQGGARVLFQNAISDLARHCLSHGLITTDLIDQCPVKIESIPDYMQPVRANAAYSMPPGHPPRGGTFFILETDRPQPPPADYRLLAAHETFPGHHLLDTCRWGHARPIRRHIEFPIFYEGWASFAEELLFDSGFFSGPADRMLMAKRRFWRAMRGQADFDIHMRRRSLEQAAAFLAAAGMAPDRAAAMVQRYILKPGYQLSYTIGRRRFRRLYDTFCRQENDPIAFARRVLAQGEISFHHLTQVLLQGG